MKNTGKKENYFPYKGAVHEASIYRPVTVNNSMNFQQLP